ncbi:MAG: hemolysin family protein [Rhodospirillaceae bacterium]
MNDQFSSPSPREPGAAPQDPSTDSKTPSAWQRLLRRFRNGANGSVRETLQEIIDERAEADEPIGDDERTILTNILTLKGRSVSEVMVPRADVIAVEVNTPRAEIVDIIAKQGHSRLPVYRESLDDAMGMIHIKDLFIWQGADKEFDLTKLLRKLLFVAPSMEVLELLLEMRARRSHMALVVDEYGGVDGLVTIEDLVEEIVGEIEDEHDRSEEPIIHDNPDGSITADARVTLEALEEKLGPLGHLEDREYIDTLGGLVFSIAGRVPIRGELVNFDGGLEFEILQADPRRIHGVRIRRRPDAPADADAPADVGAGG